MPIALLLQKPSATLPTLLAASKALAPWIDIVRVEKTIRNRAHGIFLVRWFGTSLPREGPYLSIRVANIAELDSRLLAIESTPSPVAGASSLTTPISALAGMIGGGLSSPVGQIAGTSLLLRFGGFGVTALVLALASIAGLIFVVGFVQAPGAASALALGGSAAAGVAGAVVALAVAGEEIRGVLVTAASAVAAVNASSALLDQLRGPRGAIRNPLVSKLVQLGDRVAALAAQLLGAVAFTVTEIGPRLIPAARTIVAIGRSVRTAVEFLDIVKAGLLDRIRQLTSGESAIGPFAARFGATVRQVVHDAIEVVVIGGDVVTNTLTRAADELADAVRGYLADVRRLLPTLFTGHPTVRTIVRLTELMADKTKTAPNKPGLSDILLPKVTLPDPVKILEHLAGPAVPQLSWKAIEHAAAQAPAVDQRRLSRRQRARAAVAGMATRPSIFAAELAERRDALGANRTALAALTDDMSLLVGRFLTPSLWTSVEPQVADGADAFAALVYGDVSAPPPRPLPVLRPDEPVPVRPVIGTLRLRVPGASPADVRALERTLTRRLDAQSYVVADPTWGR
ncbi:hypothetical protein [Saccharothrix sp. ALI-22-I]|uniref:hypothetical protein n=1 Tax=Saccharothrix sp. ALI-22-I TaxID=1933778 RepID=UPI0015C3CE99|nr:hypothetical protein [Saccharothrix sp. ALI-22-I]